MLLTLPVKTLISAAYLVQVVKWIQANALHTRVYASTHSRMSIPKYNSFNSCYSVMYLLVPELKVSECEVILCTPHLMITSLAFMYMNALAPLLPVGWG